MCRAAGESEPVKAHGPLPRVKQLRGVCQGLRAGCLALGLQAILVGCVCKAKVSRCYLAGRLHSLVPQVARAMDESGNGAGQDRGGEQLNCHQVSRVWPMVEDMCGAVVGQLG